MYRKSGSKNSSTRDKKKLYQYNNMYYHQHEYNFVYVLVVIHVVISIYRVWTILNSLSISSVFHSIFEEDTCRSTKLLSHNLKIFLLHISDYVINKHHHTLRHTDYSIQIII